MGRIKHDPNPQANFNLRVQFHPPQGLLRGLVIAVPPAALVLEEGHEEARKYEKVGSKALIRATKKWASSPSFTYTLWAAKKIVHFQPDRAPRSSMARRFAQLVLSIRGATIR